MRPVIETGRHWSRAQMPVIVDFHDIAGRCRLLWAKIVHEPDCAFDDMAQLPRTLVRPLENGGGALQMVTRKHIGGRHLELLRYTNSAGAWREFSVDLLSVRDLSGLPAILSKSPAPAHRGKFPCATGICVWRSFFLPVHKSGDAPVRTLESPSNRAGMCRIAPPRRPGERRLCG